MRRTGTQLIRLEASEGMVLFDGESYTTVAYVGSEEAAALWHEVPATEEGRHAPIANGNYSAGEIFDLNGTLYRALVAIARGEDVTEHNAAPIDMAATLNELETKE